MLHKILFFLCAAAILVSSAKSYSVKTLPNPTLTYGGFVCDPDAVLSRETFTHLSQILQQLEATKTVQFAVVVVHSIGDQIPKQFATELFNHWGIGHRDNDNGILLLVVIDQRSWEIETGYGIEGVLPDAVCGRVGREHLVPHFRQGNYDAGILACVNALHNLISNPQVDADVRSNLSCSGGSIHVNGWMFFSWFILMLGGALFVAIKIAVIYRSQDEPHVKYFRLKRDYSWIFLLLPSFPLILLTHFIRKRLLQHFRNKPRVSLKNGSPMTKLDETDDDLFLSAGQICEESVASVDYDVWVTDTVDDILVLRYDKMFTSYKECPECDFKTYSLKSSTIIRSATESSTGLKKEHYFCEHCKKDDIKEVIIPRITRSSSGGSSSGGSSSSSFGGGRSGGGGSGGRW